MDGSSGIAVILLLLFCLFMFSIVNKTDFYNKKKSFFKAHDEESKAFDC